jgi:glycosyltransferase involved in cell wall biosynthesis
MRIALIALHFAEYSAHLGHAIAQEHDVLMYLYVDNAKNELGDRLAKEFWAPRLQVVLLKRPAGPLAILKNWWRLVDGVRRFRPDVVHIQEELRDELVLSLPLFARYPLVITIHDPVNHSGLDSQRLRFSRYRLYRAIARGCVGRVIAHGESLVRLLERVTPRLAGHVDAIPHGPLGATGALAPASPPSVPSFLFFGRIHAYKGLRYFIEAVQRVREAGHPVKGIIAGRGSDLEPNLPRIAQMPEAFVVNSGYINHAEVARLFSDTVAAVMPYTDGTQSGVAALAIGYGRPAIASRVGAIPELVRDGVNGLLVPPCDAEALAAAMVALLADEQRWAQLADGARQLRAGELSWGHIGRRTVDTYLAAIRDRAARRA